MSDSFDLLRSEGKPFRVEKYYPVEQLTGYAYFHTLDKARQYQSQEGGEVQIKINGIGFVGFEAMLKFISMYSREACEAQPGTPAGPVDF